METHTEVRKLLFTARDVATTLGVSVAMVWRMHSQGKIPAPTYKLGVKTPRWFPQEMEAWIDAGMPDRLTWMRDNPPGQ